MVRDFPPADNRRTGQANTPYAAMNSSMQPVNAGRYDARFVADDDGQAESGALSPKTVSAHRDCIKKKLDFGTSAEMMRQAVRPVESEQFGDAPA